ncbi:hypothetical protein HanRHA438_Chr16g0759091 [Helianthus annuus]|nr:hypothetical protein HanRHA438_Chr16g0759091 [Helianthus annuus]
MKKKRLNLCCQKRAPRRKNGAEAQWISRKTEKIKPSACKNRLTRAQVFGAAFVRASTSSTKFQLRNSFLHPPCARVGLVVKHVIKLQWSSKGFTL